MMKDLSELVKSQKDSPVTSINRSKRMHKHSRRLSTMGSARQLNDRRLDTAVVLDTMYLLICGTFVFFMHAGFAMLEAGGFEDCDEKENPMGCGDGYADNGFVGGSSMFVGSGFLGKGEDADKAWAEGTIDPATYGGGQAYMWFFQWAFCTAGCSIVSGGVAERVKFPAWIVYALCMTTFIYPVVVCSTWGYGWLETFKKDSAGNPVGGYIDFAGSGVVHLCGGIAALVGAAVIGTRTGRFDPDKQEEFTPHSQPLIVLGTFILWFGWCGFNSGSTLGMSDSGTALVAAHVMMNTTLSAATGGLTVFLLQYALTKKYDCAALCNGILAGLVSVTAPCSNVELGSAVLIGLLGGFLVVGSSNLIKKLKIDDPVDAFSVHGACGIWGCLAAALFDFGSGTDKHHGWGGFSATSYEEDGEVKYMTTGDAIGANLAEVAFVICWSGGLTLVIFGVMKATNFLRIDEETESSGMDTECASPTAYNITTWDSKPVIGVIGTVKAVSKFKKNLAEIRASDAARQE